MLDREVDGMRLGSQSNGFTVFAVEPSLAMQTRAAELHDDSKITWVNDCSTQTHKNY